MSADRVKGVAGDLRPTGAAIVLSLIMVVMAQAAAGQSVCLIDQVAPGGDGNFLGDFGITVAIDGDTAIVGAPSVIPSAIGSAHVFAFDGSSWNHTQVLLPSDPEPGMKFGRSVSARDDLIVVGTGAESSYVFRSISGKWVEEQALTPWDAPDPNSFGATLGSSDDRIIVGAWFDNTNGNGAGAVYVFRYDGRQWVPEQKLFPSDAQPNHHFGHGVAIQDGVIAVGAPRDNDGCQPDQSDDCRAGAIYIFHFDEDIGEWIEHQKVLPPPLEKMTITSLRLGWDVALSDDTLLGGADASAVHGHPYCDGTGCGIAFIYTLDPDSGKWTDPQVLLPEEQGIRRFGRAVDIDGDRAIIGAFNSEVDGIFGDYHGAALVYEKQPGNLWQPAAMLLPTPNPNFWSNFGRSVGISGDVTMVGANFENSQQGAAYFHNISPTPGDVNCDGAVDALDLSELLMRWGVCPDPEFLYTDWMSCPADINGDGVVDGADLLILLSNWG